MEKALILPLDSYLYIINLMYGENEKRNNRIRNTFMDHHQEGIILEKNDFRLSLDEIKEELDIEGLPYKEGISESIKVII